ncbi:MAG: DNA-binding protein [Crenarchaeota archaeon]|nr:DNA-binding protein [Thermoproteota archaeon]MCR8453860.1 DNA-binding protein [Thermoproteota archaeon]MCR8455321.1 DNA-binding protein [Thermoproteota archaeon]MCR8462591.1 DNA-binding protein [Thermoproteota archaeon]MCR8470681.1 DNA-binding protein [Thermoproteota archaeon]
MARGKYVACTKCKRILLRKELIQEGNKSKCPFCGNDKFASNYSNIVLILNPQKSQVARLLQKEEYGLFALTLET